MLFDFFDIYKMRKLVLYTLLLLVLLFFQNSVCSRIRIWGVSAMFMPAAAVCIGLLESGMKGAAFGLVAGIFCDIAYPESVLLFTILLPILGFLAGMIAEFFINRRFFAYIVLSVPALLITAFCQMFRLLVFTETGLFALLPTALLQVWWSLPLAILLYFPCKALAAFAKE